MGKKEFAMKASLDFDGAVKCLEDLLASFKAKSIVISRGVEYVALKPGDFVEMEIEAREKKGHQKLVLELSWMSKAPTMEAQQFSIGTQEPEPAVESPEEVTVKIGTEALEAHTEEKVEEKKGKHKKGY